jgi:hypothetical protein
MASALIYELALPLGRYESSHLLDGQGPPEPRAAAEVVGDEQQLAPSGKRRILIICDFGCRYINTISDHLNAFKSYSKNDICLVDAHSAVRSRIPFQEFDGLVLHYSASAAQLPPWVAERVRAFNGYKAIYIQDEYRWVDATAAAVASLGIGAMFTAVNSEVIDRIYYHESIREVRRRRTLTGFVPEYLTRIAVPAYDVRPIDVGYRARKLPSWLGRFAQEKWEIGQFFKRDGGRYGLVCDIEYEESKRIYGADWVKFLSDCKAVLGTESGASFIDFSGKVRPAVETFEASHPGVSFEEVHARFLAERDGETVIQVISPRCFEAAALRTLMILYPGRYSGVLEAWRHYVPLQRDHNNMDEVVAVLRDNVRAQEIIDHAYREVALNPRYSFRAMVQEFDSDIAEHAPSRSRLTPYDIVRLERRVELHYRVYWLTFGNLHAALSRFGHWAINNFWPKRYRVSARDWLGSLGRHVKSMLRY